MPVGGPGHGEAAHAQSTVTTQLLFRARIAGNGDGPGPRGADGAASGELDHYGRGACQTARLRGPAMSQ